MKYSIFEIQHLKRVKTMVDALKFQTLVVNQKRLRQTAQTQIRLLLKKQSDQGLPCLLFKQVFSKFQPWLPTFYLKSE